MVEVIIKETTGSFVYILRWWEGGKQLLMGSELAVVYLSLTHLQC